MKNYDLEKAQEEVIAAASTTRQGGKVMPTDVPKKDIIVVDTREFSSLTPIFLAEKGFWIVPMQLTVGDYIISD